MKGLVLMVLMALFTTTQALSAKDLFEAQTFALFNPNHVSIEVKNSSISYLQDKVIANGDLVLKIHTDRSVIIRDLEETLRKKYVNYEFPKNLTSADTENKTANRILSNGIAEYIIRATLGSRMTKGGEVLRPGSSVTGVRDKITGEYYLQIFGENIYVKE
jgi:hypothetical protein